MQNQHADLSWRSTDGAGEVPVSERFDDPYFSFENGLEETRHVFLAGNDLPARFADGFRIAELGFGTGLNMLTAALAWQRAGTAGRLHLTSFEAYPMDAHEMRRALTAFPELGRLRDILVAAWAQGGQIALGQTVQLDVIIGDARETLPAWQGAADAWFLDGFSPAKNPELWGADLMAQVYAHTAPGGTAATYTAAGFVRRGLADAGFEVERTPGFGRKRHMTRARRRT
ncbi:tRNA (5-methylaminomethyl-2-thiouridine)(34)-methyltransferase MnmD [Roseovarius sp. LXJ103]|uniref:tRNA (5-methylaminomethyl-2-thiouridine)(34)-methyltransferase MnmD n=1 Tax=Roseovarius carneus TaxID=2853164 RepID=UPI000D615C6F|nr:tRNA (5-methylaminomethyl-2-thiouridine)(34)-methyltransferase MnmD [Roseovarius carneus]MBZ8117704.1 tRNA (5-methylaminomethyl-2-thiouridine)(34)-methyltransferase MnmD [Roseovarius carneus]PWE36522.1 FAD-dependent oxidoreductase [Pelagicola sp. LXJ1103]